jgi:hypothetical protein
VVVTAANAGSNKQQVRGIFLTIKQATANAGCNSGHTPVQLRKPPTEDMTPRRHQTYETRAYLVPVHAPCLCVAAVCQQCCCCVHEPPYTAVHLTQALTHVCATCQLRQGGGERVRNSRKLAEKVWGGGGGASSRQQAESKNICWPAPLEISKPSSAIPLLILSCHPLHPWSPYLAPPFQILTSLLFAGSTSPLSRPVPKWVAVIERGCDR